VLEEVLGQNVRSGANLPMHFDDRRVDLKNLADQVCAIDPDLGVGGCNLLVLLVLVL